MVWGERLYQRPAPLASAPSAPDYLGYQRERPLVGAEVPGVKAVVRFQHSNERDVRKIQTLRYHLRADDDVVLPRCERPELALERVLRGGGVRVHAEYPRPREYPGYLVLYALRAGALHRQEVSPARRADRSQRVAVAAVVAHHCAVRLVVGQRERAVRALYRLSAARAADAGVVAPAVQKQYRLLAVFQVLPHFLDERHAERGVVAVLLLDAHIHDVDVRQDCVVVSLVQLEQAVAPDLRVVVALKRRGRRRQQQERVMIEAALLRDVPGVVARSALGFVGALALLVDDDYAEVLHRRENRAAGPYHDMRPAGLYARVLVRALPQGKAAVEYRHVVPEKPTELPHHLRGQRYLRDQHYRGLSLLHGFVDEPYEHGGLAASGHSTEQCAPGSVVVHQLQQTAENLLLLRREHDIRRAFRLPLGVLQSEHLVFVLLQQPLVHQPLHDRRSDVQRVAHLMNGRRAVLLQELQHLLLLGGQLRRLNALRRFRRFRELHHHGGFIADAALEQLGFPDRARFPERLQQRLVLRERAVLLAEL